MPRKIFSSNNHKHTVARRDKTRPRIKKHFPELKHVPGSKTHPRIQNTFQNPKTLPWVQNTSQNPKTLPESQTLLSENPKTLLIIQNTSQKPKTHPKIQILSHNTFRFWDVFWILGRVLDSGTCFWILGHVLDFGKCFVPMRHGTNTTQIKAVTRVTVMICISL